MKKRFNLKKLNNSGSTIVTVIVVITFVTILATTILYLSGMNYFMKATDRKAKENFYNAEVCLEEVKAGLVELAAEAADRAYLNTMVKYAVDDSFSRYAEFQDEYFIALEEVWNEAAYDSSGTLNTHLWALKNMVEDEYKSDLSFVGISSDGSNEADFGKLDKSSINSGHVYIRDIKLSYTDASGYYTEITTDFDFIVPEMNWAITESLSNTTSVSDAGTEKPDVRKEYDIAEFVNYSNWQKQ